MVELACWLCRLVGLLFHGWGRICELRATWRHSQRNRRGREVLVEEDSLVCLGLAQRPAIRCQAPECVPLTLFVLLLWSVLVLLDVQDVGCYEKGC